MEFNLREDLECIVCLDLAISPIYSCVNGHILCSTCYDAVDECGLCRVLKEELMLMPCGFAERLVRKYNLEMCCRNAELGCPLSIRSTDMLTHLLNCEYRPIACAPISRGRTISCNKMINVKDLFQHLKDVHEIREIPCHSEDGSVFEFFSFYPKDFETDSSNSQDTIYNVFPVLGFNYEGAVFLVHRCMIGHSYFWWVTIIGDSICANRLEFVTSISSKTEKAKHVKCEWEMPILPLHKFHCAKEIQENGGLSKLANIHRETLLSFSEEREDSGYKFKHSWSTKIQVRTARN